MTPLRVSVVITCRGNAAGLRLCMIALAQSRCADFEVIVVASAGDLAALTPWAGRIKTIAFDGLNLSRARNLGIAQAAGEIVAFLEAGSIPEPTWLARLTEPFANETLAASGGFVRGDDGISLIRQGHAFLADASERPLILDSNRTAVLRGRKGRGIRTEPDCMAVRREVLVRHGGFDPAYKQHYGVADLNLRLSEEGAPTAIVPLAQVHRTGRDRAVSVAELREAGAGLAVFLRRHGGRLDTNSAIGRERELVRRWLVAEMMSGKVTPGDVGRLLERFDAGVSEGRGRSLGRQPALDDPPPAFVAFREDYPEQSHIVVPARPLALRPKLIEAAELAGHGHVVTLVALGPTAARHRIRFDPRGIWIQSGGVMGPSTPDDPVVRPWRMTERIARETALFRPVRETNSAN